MMNTHQIRIKEILNLINSLPEKVNRVIDVGAGNGHISKLISDLLNTPVIALDLKKPKTNYENVIPVEGDITDLKFSDNFFDLVICTEVLEHIKPEFLQKACDELQRITKKYLLIGVPFKQDLRLGRTRCKRCGRRNPPYGHVNRFDEEKLKKLFSKMKVRKISFIGKTKEVTNFISTFLLDLAGNPYGTYNQKEPCIYCGAKLEKPSPNFFQKALAKLAFIIMKMQRYFTSEKPIWIHILFEKVDLIDL